MRESGFDEDRLPCCLVLCLRCVSLRGILSLADLRRTSPAGGEKKKKEEKPEHDYLGPAVTSSKYAVNAFSADCSDQCAAMHLTDVRSASGGGTLECHETSQRVSIAFSRPLTLGKVTLRKLINERTEAESPPSESIFFSYWQQHARNDAENRDGCSLCYVNCD